MLSLAAANNHRCTREFTHGVQLPGVVSLSNTIFCLQGDSCVILSYTLSSRKKGLLSVFFTPHDDAFLGPA